MKQTVRRVHGVGSETQPQGPPPQPSVSPGSTQGRRLRCLRGPRDLPAAWSLCVYVGVARREVRSAQRPHQR